MDPKEYYYMTFQEDVRSFLHQAGFENIGTDGQMVFDSLLVSEIKNYSVVPLYRREHFIIFLALTILLDLIISKHFPERYIQFRKMAQYPKFRYGQTNSFVHPWDIAKNANSMELFHELSKFFIQDLKDFFDEKNELDIYWLTLREAFLSESNLSQGEFGSMFMIDFNNA